MSAGRVLLVVVALVTILPPCQGLPVETGSAARMQVVLVDGETLMWSRPLLQPEQMLEARYHVFGVNATGNLTLLSIHDARTFQARVPPGFASYGVAVELDGKLGAMTGDCIVIYLFSTPPSVTMTCSPPPVGPPSLPVKPGVWLMT